MRRHPLIAVVAVVIVTAGCTAQSPKPLPSPSVSTPPASPVVTQDRETGLERPEQVFDGDCAAVLVADDLAVLPGVQLTEDPYGPVARELVADQSGGLRCRWSTVDSGSVLYVVALPDIVAPGTDYSTCVDSTGADISEGRIRCEFDVIANEHRLSGWLFTAGTVISGNDLIAALSSSLMRNAASAAAPVVPIPANGAWKNPVDCVALDASIDVAALLGWPSAELIEAGTDVRDAPVYYDLWNQSSDVSCGWSGGEGRGFFLAGLGGGRWVEPLIAGRPDVVATSVPGFDAAYVTTTKYSDFYSVHTLDLFDGVDWLGGIGSEDLSELEPYHPVLSAVASGLDALN